MVNYSIKHFNELSASELYKILQLRNEVFVLEQACAYQDCDNKDLLSFHLCAFLGNSLIAYARILPEGVSYELYCSIGRVVTHTQYRGQNHGRRIMDEAIKFCKQNFDFPIKISAQAYLEKFYRDLGFITVSDAYMEDNIPHIAMVYKGVQPQETLS